MLLLSYYRPNVADRDSLFQMESPAIRAAGIPNAYLLIVPYSWELELPKLGLADDDDETKSRPPSPAEQIS